MDSLDRQFNLKIIGQHFQTSNPCLVRNLKYVDQACRNISSFWNEYDYGHVKANGFRSFVKKCNLYFENMKILVEDDNDPKLLQGYVSLLPAFVRQVKVLEFVRQKDANGHHDKTRFYFPEDNSIIQTLLSFTDEEVKPMYTQPGAFWLDPGAADLNTNLCYTILFTNSSWSEKVKLLLNPSYFADKVVHMIQNHDVDSIRDISRLASYFPFNAIVAVARYVRGTTSEYTDLPKQGQWLFQLDHPYNPVRIERRSDAAEVNRGSVKCLVIKSTAGNCNTLILHVHGSGYVAMTPADHETYLRSWSKKLNAAIVAPDYGKAPENQYPSGLQDLLDVYLHLTNSDVTGVLGFQPTRIYLTGDSAGGNMAMSLLTALNETKRRMGGEVIMPMGVCLQCPLANVLGYPASCAQTCLDIVLPSTMTMTVASSYAKTEPEVEVTWFRREGLSLQMIQEIVQSWTPRVQDPYFNLLAYDKWDELRDIPLQIQVGEFDALLDNGIEIAKRWKGSVTLDVLESMPHSFLFLPTARKEAELVVQRLKQLIHSELDENENIVIAK